jgi:rRNA maturation endonuclease Nob1
MSGETERQIVWLDEEAQEADRVWICVGCTYAVSHEATMPLFADVCLRCGSRMIKKRTLEETSSKPETTQSELTEF